MNSVIFTKIISMINIGKGGGIIRLDLKAEVNNGN